MEILARKRGVARRTETRRVRLTPAELAAWKTALEPGETLSSMVRAAVDRDLERRRREREREKERRQAGAAGVNERLVELLERARSTAVD